MSANLQKKLEKRMITSANPVSFEVPEFDQEYYLLVPVWSFASFLQQLQTNQSLREAELLTVSH